MPYLNVLIVHEDVAEGRRLMDQIDWAQLEMQAVACVSDGDQAMEFLRSHDIHLLLTDVGAALGTELLIEKLATEMQHLLLIVIAHPPKMDSVLLAMRHQSVYDYVSMPLSVQEVTEVLKSAGAFFGSWNLTMAIRRLTDMRDFDVPPKTRRLIEQRIRHILQALAAGDVETMSTETTDLFLHVVCPPDNQNVPLGQAVAVELLAHLKYLLSNTDPEYNEEFFLYSFIHKVFMTKNGADLEDLCLTYLYRYASRIAPQQNLRQMSALVRTALQITKEKYCDSSFTLFSLADEIGVSPNYLSSVFKMETGMRFKKYLNTYRIDKAKELLLDSRYKIYEVSDLVGIEDSRYFSQIFKTYIGMKPSEYRNSHQPKNTEGLSNE